MENPGNLIYAFAILSPVVLFPLFFLLRRNHTSTATVILYLAVLFSINDFIIMSSSDYASAIEGFYKSGPGIFWLVSNVTGIIATIKLQSKLSIELSNRWNVIYMLIVSLFIFIAGLMLYSLGLNLWEVAQAAMNLY